MARGINKVILIGNVGQDPEVKYMPSGGAVTNISIATSETWKDKNTGQPQERTEWHRVVFFNRLGEIAGEYLRKGSKVYIEGALRTRKWQAQDGTDRYTTEIVANEMQMLDGRGDNAGSGMGNDSGSNNYGGNNSQNYNQSQPANPGAPLTAMPGGASQNGYTKPALVANTPPQQPPGFDSFDDDIPF